MSREEDFNRIQDEVAKEMANHTYTKVASGEGSVVWRCERKGSSVYGFDLLISKYGMSMIGDINPVNWRVGLNYGLPFLARKISRYELSKVESTSVKKVLDTTLLKGVVFCEIAPLLEDVMGDKYPLETTCPNYDDSERQFDLLSELVSSLRHQDEEYCEFACELADEAFELFQDMRDLSDDTASIDEAYRLLTNFPSNLELFQYVHELQLSKVDDTTLSNLFMARHAAIEILKLEDSK